MKAMKIFGIYTTMQINLAVLIYASVNNIAGVEFIWCVVGVAFNSWIVSNQICLLTNGEADTRKSEGK